MIGLVLRLQILWLTFASEVAYRRNDKIYNVGEERTMKSGTF